MCGSDDSYMKKSVVPHEYRRHFPAVMKNHHSHDILLTCQSCHRLAGFHDNQLRKEQASKYNAPLGMFMWSVKCKILGNLCKDDDYNKAMKDNCASLAAHALLASLT